MFSVQISMWKKRNKEEKVFQFFNTFWYLKTNAYLALSKSKHLIKRKQKLCLFTIYFLWGACLRNTQRKRRISNKKRCWHICWMNFVLVGFILFFDCELYLINCEIGFAGAFPKCVINKTKYADQKYMQQWVLNLLRE